MCYYKCIKVNNYIWKGFFMRAVTMNQHSFAALSDLDVPIINTEGRLYILNDRLLFKRFYVDEGEYFGNKLLTLNTLIDNREALADRSLILPEKIVLVDKKVVGFTMPFIKDNINLTILLESRSIPFSTKIEYLRRVGEILENVQNVKEFKGNFFLGDVNSNNFVVRMDNAKLRELYAVDLDSSRIGDNLPFPSKILSTNFNLRNNKKYKISKNGLIEPDANTEWLCYCITILNFIGNFNINSLSESQFYNYLTYLNDLGFNKELIDCFSRIYSRTDNNVNPQELIESIPSDYTSLDYSNLRRKL